MTLRQIALFCLLGGFLFQGLPAGGQDDPCRLVLELKDIEESLRTDWYGLYLTGKKIGYAEVKRTKVGDKENAGYRDMFLLHMKVASFGMKTEVKIQQVVEFDGRPPYRLRGGNWQMTTGDSTQQGKLQRTPKGFQVVTTTGQAVNTKDYPSIDYTLADAMTSDLWVRRGAKVGDRIGFRDFEIQEMKTDLSQCKLLAAKTSLVNGVQVKYVEIEMRSKSLTFVARQDSQGRLLSGHVGIFEMRLETEEQAKNTEYSQDLFVLGQVKIDRPLGQTTELTDLVLAVAGKEGSMLKVGPRQLVIGNADGTHTIKLGKRHGQPVKATAREIEDNLAETAAYPLSHAKVKALAAKAVGQAKTPAEKVRNLVAFVHEFVEPRLSLASPNILELMDKKRGDCKSYALLLTTLARAAGIPAREVGGLMYLGDDQKAFGGHAWNEVVLDGHWLPVDASLNETEINASHVSFGADTAVNNVLNILGKLSFKLDEVKQK